MMVRVYKRGLFTISQLKVILRTSYRRSGIRCHASFIDYMLNGVRKSDRAGVAAANLQVIIWEQNIFLELLLMFLISTVSLTSCEKTDGDNIGIEVQLSNYLEDELFLLNVDSVLFKNGYWQSSAVVLGITPMNNFYVNGELVLNHGAYTDCAIANIGSVHNLGSIRNIPATGWTTDVRVKPGNGYVIRSKTYDQSAYGNTVLKQYCRYARVYVVDWIESTSGGIIGATICYQDNWRIDQ